MRYRRDFHKNFRRAQGREMLCPMAFPPRTQFNFPGGLTKPVGLLNNGNPCSIQYHPPGKAGSL